MVDMERQGAKVYSIGAQLISVVSLCEPSRLCWKGVGSVLTLLHIIIAHAIFCEQVLCTRKITQRWLGYQPLPKTNFITPQYIAILPYSQGLPLRCSFAAVNELLTKESPCPPPRHGSRCPLKRLFFNRYTSKITRSGLYCVELPFWKV